MNSKEKILQSFEKAGIPIVAIIYSLTVVIQFNAVLEKLGWRVFSILALLMSICWTVYVWTAKIPSSIAPNQFIHKYGKVARYLAFSSTLIAIIPTWYSILPTSSRIPPILFKLYNNSDQPVSLSHFGSALFTIPDGPFSEMQVAATRVRVYSSQGNDSLVVPAKSNCFIVTQFLNEGLLIPLIEQGDVALRIVIETNDGRVIQRYGIPFTKKFILSGYYELKLE